MAAVSSAEADYIKETSPFRNQFLIQREISFIQRERALFICAVQPRLLHSFVGVHRRGESSVSEAGVPRDPARVGANQVFGKRSRDCSRLPPSPSSSARDLRIRHYRNLRRNDSLYPGTGEYDKFFGEGVYGCAGCGTPLYKSSTKFNSGCGWPAFYEGFPGAIRRTTDPDGRRTDITCAACGGHMGHVFKGEGFNTPTDERHCVNSISLKFIPASEEAAS